MSIRKIFVHGMVWTASLGVVAPTAVRAASPYAPAAQPQTAAAPQLALNAPVAAAPVVDVALQPGGVLTGRVVDASGSPAAHVPVEIRHQGVQVAQFTTDENGVFTGQELRGGVHEVATPNCTNTCRLWTAEAAPPVAQPCLEVVNGPVHRGQYPMPGRGFGLLANPWVLGMGVAAAIAIPLALDDDDDNAS